MTCRFSYFHPNPEPSPSMRISPVNAANRKELKSTFPGFGYITMCPPKTRYPHRGRGFPFSLNAVRHHKAHPLHIHGSISFFFGKLNLKGKKSYKTIMIIASRIILHKNADVRESIAQKWETKK